MGIRENLIVFPGRNPRRRDTNLSLFAHILANPSLHFQPPFAQMRCPWFGFPVPPKKRRFLTEAFIVVPVVA
jgi:hypothetical protein